MQNLGAFLPFSLALTHDTWPCQPFAQARQHWDRHHEKKTKNVPVHFLPLPLANVVSLGHLPSLVVRDINIYVIVQCKI